MVTPIQRFWKSILSHSTRTPKRQQHTRLSVEVLEDRCTPATATGVLSGAAFIDTNSNGAFDATEAPLPGVVVSLTGTTSTSVSVNATVVTNSAGAYSFLNVLPGTYSLAAAPVPGFVGGGVTIATGITLASDQTIDNLNAGFRGGIAAGLVSLRHFLASATGVAFPFASAGSGQNLVNPRADNSAPTVNSGGIGDRTLGTSSSQVIDLAGFFSDADFTNSQVTLNIANGNSTSQIKLTLFDTQTPQTVANFFGYIKAGSYDNSIFHRISSVADSGVTVLQGGALALADATGTNLIDVPSVALVPNEFLAANSNVQNTIAMARPSGGIDNASNQFFFNLTNNTNLDAQNFTVFGNITDFNSQFALGSLGQTDTQDLSASPFAAAHPQAGLSTLPLNNYTGSPASFPGDAVADNYMRITSVTIDKQDESLTFTAVSDNPSVVAILPIANHSEMLSLVTSGATGVANITVTATDQFGASVQTTFQVTVS